jgi:hypothetical protein
MVSASVLTFLPAGDCLTTKSLREGEEERNGEEVRDTTLGGTKIERIYISGFEGSQAVPACPSGRGSSYDIN